VLIVFKMKFCQSEVVSEEPKNWKERNAQGMPRT